MFFLIILLAVFTSCDSNKIFEENIEVSGGIWKADNILKFEVDIPCDTIPYNLFVNIRNSSLYQTSNLWLFIKIKQPGEISVTDTFEVALAMPSGKWLGEGFGGIKTQQVSYRKNVYFPVSGDYKIEIQHGMRDELLEGITDVGFRIEKAD